MVTVPVLHTIRTARGSFFFIAMAKPVKTITDQISLLKSRGMSFSDENQASHYLSHISYYRLKGYWWDMQKDRVNHIFYPDSVFETVIERYNFDRYLRLILFDAIERIEIALRTKMIYHLSLTYGTNWYQDSSLFSDVSKHSDHLSNLLREFGYSPEIFIRKRTQNKIPKYCPRSLENFGNCLNGNVI